MKQGGEKQWWIKVKPMGLDGTMMPCKVEELTPLEDNFEEKAHEGKLFQAKRGLTHEAAFNKAVRDAKSSLGDTKRKVSAPGGCAYRPRPGPSPPSLWAAPGAVPGCELGAGFGVWGRRSAWLSRGGEPPSAVLSPLYILTGAVRPRPLRRCGTAASGLW